MLWDHLKPAMHSCLLNTYGIIWEVVSLYNESSQNRADQLPVSFSIIIDLIRITFKKSAALILYC